MKPQQEVVIVGGGTAGWLTAASLVEEFGTRVRVTLIEPSALGRISVGESTLPTIHRTLRRLGLTDLAHLREFGATFKHGIQFNDWLEPEHQFHHPYDVQQAPNFAFLDGWLQANDPKTPFSDLVTDQPSLAKQKLSPYGVGADRKLVQHLNHSYHIDAERFAEFLKKRYSGEQRPVELIDGQVKTVDRAADGSVLSVGLSSGQRISGDLFIDCSGQKRVLSKPETNDFIGFDALPNDRALACHVDHTQASKHSAQTLATATGCGWIWDIPLSDRRGVGQVYASRFDTPDSALIQLNQYLGKQALTMDDVKVISFKAGYQATPWQHNVVSIGLSSGFIEPLESTGIYFIEEAIELLLAHFPMDQHPRREVQFNRALTQRYRECADFVFLHYALSRRDDSDYWRYMTTENPALAKVNEQLSYWKQQPPSAFDFTDQRQIFAHVAYEFVLYGMLFKPEHYALNRATTRDSTPFRHTLSATNLVSSAELLARIHSTR